MQHLPVEVWEDIVLFLHASSQVTHRIIRESRVSFNIVSRTLRSLSLTSNALREICQPLLFSKVTFGERGTRDPLQHLQALTNLLDSRPEAACWIEEAIVFFAKGALTPRKQLAERTAKVLIRLTKLEKLVIYKSYIDDALYWALFSIPSLRNLTLLHSIFMVNTVKPLQGPFTCSIISMTAESLPMAGSVEESLPRLVLSSNLRTLTLRSPGGLLAIYGLCNENVVCHTLFELDMEEPRDAQLDEFIVAAKMFPELSTLVFTHAAGPTENAWEDVTLVLDKSVLPKLSRFSGAIKLARWIVPGRPVVSVRIPQRRDMEIWLDSMIFKPFQFSEANLVNLTLGRCRSNVSWYTYISKPLPNLEVLILWFSNRMTRVSEV